MQKTRRESEIYLGTVTAVSSGYCGRTSRGVVKAVVTSFLKGTGKHIASWKYREAVASSHVVSAGMAANEDLTFRRKVPAIRTSRIRCRRKKKLLYNVNT